MAKIIVFFSTKGGVGKTTIALNAAVSLSLKKKKVLLLDLDLGAPLDMAKMGGIKPKKAFVDLLSAWEKVENNKTLLKESFFTRVNPYLDFFPAVLNLRSIAHVKAERVGQALNVFQELEYDYIIVDGGKSLTDVLITIFDNSSLILLVVAPDILSLYQTKWVLDTLQTLGFPLGMIKGVLNRSESKGSVSVSEIRVVLPINILSLVPSEGKIVAFALNKGIPVVLDSPKSRIRAAFDSLAESLTGLDNLYISHKKLADLRVKNGSVKKSGPDFWVSLGLVEPLRDVGLGDRDDVIIKLKERAHQALVEEMNLRRFPLDVATADTEQRKKLKERAEKILANILSKEAQGIISSLEVRRKLTKEIVDEALGLGPLEDLIKDPAVTEVMVNNKNQIYVEKAGRIEVTSKRFTSNNQIRVVIERILAPLGRRIDESSPYVDARLPDGSRVNAIIPPLSLTGPTLTIRKFAKQRLTVEDLVKRFGSLTEDMAKFLEASVRGKKNILVSGGTGSGKTTFLNILSEYIPDGERIITIEDSAELKLHHQHWIRLESRPANIEGRGEVAISDLFRNTLRMRPDRIIVGESRGKEILDMLQAMNTGHDGSMSTIHANSTHDVLIRLDSMILMSGAELPIRAIREMVSSAVDLIVHTSRFNDGSRKVVQVTELAGMFEETQISLKDIFTFKQTGVDASGKVIGSFVPTGYIPTFYEDIRAKGIPLSKEIFNLKSAT